MKAMRTTFLLQSAAFFFLSLCVTPAVGQVSPAAEPLAVADSSRQLLLPLVQAPEGVQVTLFAAPSEVNYPACLTATLEGVVFVCVDKNGSLSRDPGNGSILRLVDEDKDGEADSFTAFVDSVDSPRGLFYDGETLFVVHPPYVSAYRDTNGDGVADASQILVRGLGFGLDFRGADHTTNGMEMGIDGWLYIAVGDYGFVKAVGSDGTEIQNRGGSVVRVRPDGSELEVYSRGSRNDYDIAIDPYLNGFMRGNTNDGGGWDVRLNHAVAGADYGYPSLFRNFGDEVMPPLADYGGGSGTGALFVHDPGLPAPYGNSLYTVDWGTSQIYRHALTPRGATFSVEQEPFVSMPAPTDMTIDGNSQIFAASWFGGGFNYGGENVGFIVRLTMPGSTPSQAPDLDADDDARLVELVASGNQVHRIQAQQEILRRGANPNLVRLLEQRVLGDDPAYARVAAIFTLKQLLGADSHDVLLQAAQDHAVRAYALRALADRRGETQNVPVEPFITALGDPDPAVQLQAVIGLGRMGATEAADAILPLTASADSVVRHIAVRTLVSLNATEASLRALQSGPPEVATGALRVLQQIHDTPTVMGLIEALPQARSEEMRNEILQALARLHYREGIWTGTLAEWWGTRPPTMGPYHDPVAWKESARIRPVLEDALLDASGDALASLIDEYQRHRILPAGSETLLLTLIREQPARLPEVVGMMLGQPLASPDLVAYMTELAGNNPSYRAGLAEMVIEQGAVSAATLPLLRQIASSTDLDPAARARALGLLADADSPEALDATVAVLSSLEAGPDLHEDLDRAWRQFISSRRHRRNADYFIGLAQSGDEGQRVLAYSVLLQLLAAERGVEEDARARVGQAIAGAWAQPGVAALLRAVGLTEAQGYADQVRSYQAENRPAEVRQAAAFAAERLGISAAATESN